MRFRVVTFAPAGEPPAEYGWLLEISHDAGASWGTITRGETSHEEIVQLCGFWNYTHGVVPADPSCSWDAVYGS